jgi:hypothetical protein
LSRPLQHRGGNDANGTPEWTLDTALARRDLVVDFILRYEPRMKRTLAKYLLTGEGREDIPKELIIAQERLVALP